MVRSPSATAKGAPCAAFQSHPTDLDLVNTYLRPWVEEGAKAAFIHEFDVYAVDPADLTRQFAPAVAQDGERAWYFYTSLRHKSLHGKRKARTVATGTGCWHNEAKSKPIYTRISGKRQIGHRQSFSFVNKQGGGRSRTGWLMMELRLVVKDYAGQEAEEESALGNLALCKVYRSPRNPEPIGGDAAAAAAALPGRKAEADDDGDESSSATATDDGDSSEGSPKGKSDDEGSSDATMVAPRRHGKTEPEISAVAATAAAAGGIGKALGREDSDEASAVAPALKRKLSEDESSGPARKRKANVDTSPGAPAPATEMHCPQCGTHLVLTIKKKAETEVAKNSPAVPDAATPRRFHEWL